MDSFTSLRQVGTWKQSREGWPAMPTVPDMVNASCGTLTSPRSHQRCPPLAQQRGTKWNRETWNNCGIPWFTPPCKVMRKTHHCGLCIDTRRRTRWFIRTKPTAVQTGIWNVAQKASKHLLLLKNRSRLKGESVSGELLYFIVCDSLVHRDNLQCEGHQEGTGHEGFHKPKKRKMEVRKRLDTDATFSQSPKNDKPEVLIFKLIVQELGSYTYVKISSCFEL